MRKFNLSILALFFMSMLIISCGAKKENADSSAPKEEKATEDKSSSSSDTEETSNEDEASTDAEESEEAGDCDDMLADYEEYMTEYIDLAKQIKSNPSDASIMSEYAALGAKGAEWASKTKDCAKDAKFAAKFSAVAMKLQKAMSGM